MPSIPWKWQTDKKTYSSKKSSCNLFTITMKLIRNLPNLLTLFNLFLGCMAIAFYFNDPMVVFSTVNKASFETQTGNIYLGNIDWACYCIFLAAIIDFFDGFVARMLKVESALGKQLDSLADMVTFGLVPGLIMYQLLAFSYYANSNSFDYYILYFSGGFLITLCAAWRLAKFNLDAQSAEFKGLPTPSAALIVASLPLIILRDEMSIAQWLENPYIVLGIILLLSYLMVSNTPMMSLKIKSFKFEDNQWLFGLCLLSIIVILLGAMVLHIIFLVIPIIIILYIVLSIIKNISTHGI